MSEDFPSPDDVVGNIRKDLGGLVEVVLDGVGPDGWREVLVGLLQAGFDVQLTDAGRTLPVGTGTELLAGGEDSPYLASVRVGNQTWTSSVSEAHRIDFQCDAEDFRTRADVSEARVFMAVMSAAAGTACVLVPESAFPAQFRPYLVVQHRRDRELRGIGYDRP